MPRASGATVELVRGKWGRGSGKPGVFRGRHTPGVFRGVDHAPAEQDSGDFCTDSWVDFLADGQTEGVALQFVPRPAAERGGRVDIRVKIPPLGGYVHFTRVLALAFLGRTWEELKATHANGQHRLVVHHESEKPWQCWLGNLRVVSRRQNQRIETRRAAEGRRPPRGQGRKRAAEDEDEDEESEDEEAESEA